MLEQSFNAHGCSGSLEELLCDIYADEEKKAARSVGTLAPIRTADDLIDAASAFDLFTNDGRQAFLAARELTDVSLVSHAPDVPTRIAPAPSESSGPEAVPSVTSAWPGSIAALHRNPGAGTKHPPPLQRTIGASAFGAGDTTARQMAEVHAHFGGSVSASAQARVGFATKWLKAHHAAGRLPTVHESAANQTAYADKIGTTCDSSHLICHHGFDPIPSVLVYARDFEANASSDGNTAATCRALAEAGYMRVGANGQFKRSLLSAKNVTHVYQLNGSILIS